MHRDSESRPALRWKREGEERKRLERKTEGAKAKRRCSKDKCMDASKAIEDFALTCPIMDDFHSHDNDVYSFCPSRQTEKPIYHLIT